MAINRKIFHYNEKRQCPEVQTYLENLSDEEKPWGCPYLKILPEDIIILKDDNKGPPHRYKKGDFMCTERSRHDVSKRCRGIEKPKFIDDKTIEGKCDWPLNGKIILKIKK